MKKFAIIVLAAATLMQAALSVAGDKSDSPPKPSSMVPHAHTNTHVYGSPIQPAIVGHSNVSHHQHTPKKRSPSPKK
jgi:hypothetical protein